VKTPYYFAFFSEHFVFIVPFMPHVYLKRLAKIDESRTVTNANRFMKMARSMLDR